MTEFKANLMSLTSFSWKVGRAGRVDEEVAVEIDGKTVGEGKEGDERNVEGNEEGAGRSVGENLIRVSESLLLCAVSVLVSVLA